MSRIRIVVADQAEAIFYDLSSLKERPVEVARLADPAAHLHDRDFSSDRPGRSYESFGKARHAMEGENDPRQREAVKFAKEIAGKLDLDRRNKEYEQLIVVAGAPFRSLIREEFSADTKACVVHEIPKDLVHSSVEVLREHLPTTAQELKST
jgi:protein required for attachment to host cells